MNPYLEMMAHCGPIKAVVQKSLASAPAVSLSAVGRTEQTYDEVGCLHFGRVLTSLEMTLSGAEEMIDSSGLDRTIYSSLPGIELTIWYMYLPI
jgi:hypothetical protein